MTVEAFRILALTTDQSTEQPHFEKTSFRLKGKIFATLDDRSGTAVLKLTPVQQSVFCAFDPAICYPVPNKWGLQGWTEVRLEAIDDSFAADILQTAAGNISPKKKA